ncbi:MAG: SRPBCC domain-containing protein [Acidimicrobiales bacterium]
MRPNRANACAAPIDLVWSMWTEAGHFAKWYGPMGASIPTARMELEVGGQRFIEMAMETPGGPMQMFFIGDYREIEPTTRLVYTESVASADGTPLTSEQMGMPAGMPMETSVVVEPTDLGGATKMAMTHVGVPADSPGGQGWTMAIDKLEARLAELS